MKESYVEFEGVRVPCFVHESVLTRLGRLPDFISAHIETTHEFFEVELLSYWKEKFGKVGSFVDIGANIGNHSLFVSRFMDCPNVTCFEPLAQNFEVLKANLPHASLHMVGLSDKEGELAADIGLIGVSGSPGRYLANAGGTALTEGSGIPIRTLDSFNPASVDLLKVDVEEMEPMVLKGSAETIERCRPHIYCEANRLSGLLAQMEVLAPLGYCITRLSDDGNLTAEFTPKEKL